MCLKVRSLVIRDERLFIGRNRCRVRDFVVSTQCFKYQQNVGKRRKRETTVWVLTRNTSVSVSLLPLRARKSWSATVIHELDEVVFREKISILTLQSLYFHIDNVKDTGISYVTSEHHTDTWAVMVICNRYYRLQNVPQHVLGDGELQGPLKLANKNHAGVLLQ